MSRIGKNPVSIPQGVDVNINDNIVTVKGKLGELSQSISSGITIKIEDSLIVLDRDSESKDHKAQHGLMRACLLYTSPSPRDAHESRMPSSA